MIRLATHNDIEAVNQALSVCSQHKPRRTRDNEYII